MADRKFELQGPDEKGDVWICSPEGRDVWCQNLGPWEDAAEILSEWLGSVDYLERGDDLTSDTPVRFSVSAAAPRKRRDIVHLVNRTGGRAIATGDLLTEGIPVPAGVMIARLELDHGSSFDLAELGAVNGDDLTGSEGTFRLTIKQSATRIGGDRLVQLARRDPAD